MATVNITTNTLDYTVELTEVIAQLTRIADALSSQGVGGGGMSPAFTRAMTMVSLKASGSLREILNEMHNPTVII